MSYIPKKCPDCGANLDPGERCDCRDILTNQSACVVCGKYVPEGRQVCSICELKLKPGIEDRLTIGVDISNGRDISGVCVARHKNGICTIINQFFGEEAEELYKKLITYNGGGFGERTVPACILKEVDLTPKIEEIKDELNKRFGVPKHILFGEDKK